MGRGLRTEIFHQKKKNQIGINLIALSDQTTKLIMTYMWFYYPDHISGLLLV